MKRALPIDKTDLVSLPMFALTMMAEARELNSRSELREHGDLDDWTRGELSDPSLPADPLVPVGYERSDTRASLWMLAGNITVNLALAGVMGRVNRRLFSKRLTTIDGRRGAFVAAMVTWDFLYYWSHRWQHEKRVFWASHVVHHSSEHYNLSTALRQPWSGFLLSWVFFPMPLLGFSPALTAKAGQLNLLYQYWIHTETIDRLAPPAESLLNTPSHHRVHHGANPQYLDKNYGGILITWDKVFGTFEPEVRRIKYGLTKNIKTFNPFRIAYGEFADIARDVRSATGVRNKLGHVWKRPGWQPDTEPIRPSDLVDTFHDRTLPKQEWTHEAHLIVCWYALRGMGVEEAIAHLRKAIRAYNEATGIPNTNDSGYHETLTRYYVEAIAQLVGRPLDDVYSAEDCRREAPLTYWSREALFSVAARRDWLDPDLDDLPWRRHPEKVSPGESAQNIKGPKT